MSIAGLTSALLLASAPVYSGSTQALVATPHNAAQDRPSLTAQAVPESAVPVVNTDPLLQAQTVNTAVELAQPLAIPKDGTKPVPAEAMFVTEQPSEQSDRADGIDQNEGAIVVTGRIRTPGDPLQRVNAQSYAITQTIDEAVVAPSAHAYEKRVPEPLRNGLRNFANNLHEPAVFANFLLQLKPGKAAETAGRFLVNSTFLPIVGPTTIRDLIGGGVDAFAIPIPSPAGKSLSKPAVAIPTSIARELDKRVEFDEELEIIHNSNDPYVAAREYYLQKRQAQIDGLCSKSDLNADSDKRPL